MTMAYRSQMMTMAYRSESNDDDGDVIFTVESSTQLEGTKYLLENILNPKQNPWKLFFCWEIFDRQ